MDRMDYVRNKVVYALIEIVHNKKQSNAVLRDILCDKKLDQRDKRFIKEIVFGTVENIILIDWVFMQFSKIPLNKIDVRILNIIRMGIYQIIFLDRVPDFAACNECVNITKIYKKNAAGFVNGILRNVSRNKSRIKYPDKNKSIIKYLSVKYSFAESILKLWLGQFSPKFVEQLCIYSNKRAPITIRVNTLKIKKQQLKKMFEKKGIIVNEGIYNQESLVLDKTGDILELDEYKQGLFTIQDESSMLACKALAPQKGEKILDMCSAPGGKATHIAQLMQDCGIIIARDITNNKVELIRTNSMRMGIHIINAEVFNGLEFDKMEEGTYDRVLLDAPCSGLGVIRKKPDIKLNKKFEDFNKLKTLQSKLLNNASKYIKKGGIIVYSTCTINKQENQDIIDNFLESNPNFYLCDLSSELGIGNEHFINLYPNIHGVDGFFIAKIKRLE